MGIERTAHPYIVRDSAIYGGEPIVEGTRIGVRHIILLFQSGKDPEEIARIHRLSLAQVYDAISYFYDNEGEIEHYIRHESWGNGQNGSFSPLSTRGRLVWSFHSGKMLTPRAILCIVTHCSPEYRSV